MRRILLLAAIALAGCAHNPGKLAAKVSVQGNVGLTVAQLVAKLGAPASESVRQGAHGIGYIAFMAENTMQHRLVYTRNVDGHYCITTYITDDAGIVVVGVHLHGDGCYSGLATY